MRLLATFALSTICLTAIGQIFPIKTLTYYPRTYIDSESRYTDSTRKGLIIQNSLPKGGVSYTDATGKNFAYVIFWSRVINEGDTPLELEINFPSDSIPIFPSPDSYLKLYLLPDTMTMAKESLYNYGVTDLESFLATDFYKATRLQRTISPKEECLFYIAAVSYGSGGRARAGLILKEQDLFYRISLDLNSAQIPCGHIVLKN